MASSSLLTHSRSRAGPHAHSHSRAPYAGSVGGGGGDGPGSGGTASYTTKVAEARQAAVQAAFGLSSRRSSPRHRAAPSVTPPPPPPPTLQSRTRSRSRPPTMLTVSEVKVNASAAESAAASAATATATRTNACREGEPPSADDGSTSSAALAVQRGALRGSYEALDERPHPHPLDVEPDDDRSDYDVDVDLTSVADTTITTKFGSPSPVLVGSRSGRSERDDSGADRTGRGKRRSVSKRDRDSSGKKVFPRSSILKFKINTPSSQSRSRRKEKAGKSKARTPRSVGSGSASSRLSWLSPRQNVRRLRERAKVGRAAGGPRGGGPSDASAASTVLAETRRATRDAWMCGLCGTAFAAHRDAEAHEARCVRDAFSSSVGPVRGARTAGAGRSGGWAPTPTLTMTPAQRERAGGGAFFARSPLVSPHSDDTMERTNAADGPDEKMGAPGAVSQVRARAQTVRDSGPSVLTPAPEGPSDDVQSPELPTVRNRSYSDSYVDAGPTVGSPPLWRRQEHHHQQHVTFHPDTPPANEAYSSGVGGGTNRYAPRSVSSHGYDIPTVQTALEPGAIHLSNTMRRCVLMTDEAIVKVARRATRFVVTPLESDAERELALLARDRAYYDMLAARKNARLSGRAPLSDSGRGVIKTVKGRFAEAYRMIKEGDEEGGSAIVDQYKTKSGGKAGAGSSMEHGDSTLYINVIVKNSVDVINNELERLAKSRWENPQGGGGGSIPGSGEAFEWFRAVAQLKLVKLAGLALASDFTPRRIAVQLSNDLYRLMVPELKAQGVTIQTEIEYRVGAYFVLAVNVLDIDWILFMKHTNREVRERKRRWKQAKQERTGRRDSLSKSISEIPNARASTAGGGGADADDHENRLLKIMHQFYFPTVYELLAQCLALLYHLHWTISVPMCMFFNHFFLRATMRKYILTSTIDVIFYYVEKKGMEMDLSVKEAKHQASFMLAALREMREDERSLRKKKAEAEADDKGTILGPLLGPAIKEDSGPAIPPPGFTAPDNLEDVNLEMDLPVGYRRLRWALLNKDSSFVVEAVMKQESNYEDITFGDWDRNNDEIGLPKTPDGANFIGATAESSYLMPKSAFVKANMCFETTTLAEYNDYCFVLRKQARTPDVPYGNTFMCHTQISITNIGNNSCRMVCSVEAEFPNGPPMIGRQIKSGMRAGTADAFVIYGQTICKYADEYP